MTLTISGDFAVVDGTETVTYFARTAHGSNFTQSTVTGALRRVTSKEDITRGGFLGKATLTWHVWTANLGGIVPKVNDVVQDASSNRWTVEDVQIQSLGSRFKLVCLKERP